MWDGILCLSRPGVITAMQAKDTSFLRIFSAEDRHPIQRAGPRFVGKAGPTTPTGRHYSVY